MRATPGRWTRTVAALAVATTSALVALVGPASPAQALPSGTAWAGSWSYYTPEALQYAVTLPGVKLTGYATDNAGTRSTVGTIQDTADDNRCARVQLYASGVGYIADRTTCGNGTYLTYSTGPFHEGLLIVVHRTVPNTTTSDTSSHVFVPGSTGDAQLRTVGTGTSWSYYTPTSFQYTVTRPGVKITGYGTQQSLGRRSSLNSLQKTVATAGCATGAARAAAGTAVTGSSCATGESDTFSSSSFTGWIEVDGCYRPATGTARCTTVSVPEPQ